MPWSGGQGRQSDQPPPAEFRVVARRENYLRWAFDGQGLIETATRKPLVSCDRPRRRIRPRIIRAVFRLNQNRERSSVGVAGGRNIDVHNFRLAVLVTEIHRHD